MNPQIKIDRQRVSVLELGGPLPDASGACRQRGVSPRRSYECCGRLQTQGLERSKVLPPVHQRPPVTTPPEAEERIVALSLELSALCCSRLKHHFALDGISLSAPTIQRVLNNHEKGTRYHRWLKREQQQTDQSIERSAAQGEPIEKHGPALLIWTSGWPGTTRGDPTRAAGIRAADRLTPATFSEEHEIWCLASTQRLCGTMPRSTP